MALKTELMASSAPGALADKLGYDTPATAVVAAGSGQSSATALTSNFSIVASGSGGVVLSEKRARTVVINNSGGSINVYPFSGAAINALSANAAFAVGNGKQAFFEPAGLNIAGILSA